MTERRGGKIEKLEDIVAWQRARVLVGSVYDASRTGVFARDLGLAGQMQRAAVSIMSNIAEGYERRGRGEFAQFLTIAKGSCGETRSLLYVALDVGYIDGLTFDRLLAVTDDVARTIAGLRTAVEQQRDAQRPQRRNAP